MKTQQYRIVSFVASIVLLLGVAFMPQKYFGGLSGRFISSLFHLSQPSESQIFPSVKAFQNTVSNYTSWPWSKKYRDFAVDAWVMPFEIYETKSNIMNGGGVQYERNPVYMDLNGDSMTDVLFSYYSPGNYGSWQQYLLLNTGSGFQVAWKCVMAGGQNSKFYGDCADPNSLYDDTVPSVPATGVQDFFYSRAYDWSQRIRGMAEGSSHFLSGSLEIFDWGYQSYCPSGIGYYGTSACDGKLAKLIDANGDGLLDVLLKATIMDRNSGNSNNQQRNMQLMLYNTGSGFMPARACYPLVNIGYYGTHPSMQGAPEGTYCY
jgi:hypothetical protein